VHSRNKMGKSSLSVTYRTSIRVRYADTDQMQIVYNGKYLEYFEVGRTELLRAAGLLYSEFEKTGFRLPLREAYCRFILPARYDDLLIVESRVEDYTSPRLHIDYRILRGNPEELLSTGYTIHAFQNIETGKVMRPPSHYVEVLRRFHIPQ